MARHVCADTAPGACSTSPSVSSTCVASTKPHGHFMYHSDKDTGSEGSDSGSDSAIGSSSADGNGKKTGTVAIEIEACQSGQ